MTTVVCVPLYSVGFSYRGLAPWTCALCFEVDRRTGCRYRRTGRRYRQPVDRPPVDRSRSTGRPARLPVGSPVRVGWRPGRTGKSPYAREKRLKPFYRVSARASKGTYTPLADRSVGQMQIPPLSPNF